MNSLIADGVIIEYGTLESTGGRKTMLLSVNPEYAYIIGIDLGGYASKVGIIRMDGTIIDDQFILTNGNIPAQGFTIQDVLDCIEKIIESYGKERFLAISVGISGMVKNETGEIIFCPNLIGWNNVPLKQIIFDTFGIFTNVDTSARFTAIAEQKYGAGIGIANQIFISLGSISIAAALIFDSRIFFGSSGFSGEFGHVTSSNMQHRCTCGNYDCLENSATLEIIIRDIADDIKSFKGFSPLKQLIAKKSKEDRLTPQDIARAMEDGDKLCGEVISLAGERCGMALSNLLNVLNTEMVILGGGVVEYFPTIIDIIREEVRKRALVPVQQKLVLKKAETGWRGSLIGAAQMVLLEFFR